MKSSLKGFLASAAGVAVLATGATFALWSDSSTVDGGVLTSGTLDVEFLGEPIWADTSIDRLDVAHMIDLDLFETIPGDTLSGAFVLDTALSGDNVVADLTVGTSEDASGALLAAVEGVTLTYSLIGADGEIVENVQDVELGTVTTLTFAASDNTAAGSTPTIGPALDSVPDYLVVINAVFDSDTPDQVSQNVQADLKNLVVSLNQTRTAGSGAGF